MTDYDEMITYKIVLLGDSGVGKTNITKQFVTKSTPKTETPTIGVDFATKVIQLNNTKKVKTQIWDTAGQERYKAITSAHYRKALGAILVYDITRRQTFESLKKWIDELKFHGGDNVKILLAGNKVDLVKGNKSSDRQVSYEEAKKLADEHGMMFKETSAKEDENVRESFEELVMNIYQDVGEMVPDDKNVVVKRLPSAKEDDKCPC